MEGHMNEHERGKEISSHQMSLIMSPNRTASHHSLPESNEKDERIPLHFKYEDMFLRFYSRILDKHLVVDPEYRRSPACVHLTAVRWLEMNCSAKFGFPGELHHPELEQDSCYMIPTGFDSSLLLPFLITEGLDQRCIDSLVNAVQIHERKASGFWTYFPPIDKINTTFVLDDIEDTSVALLALFVADKRSKDYCQQLAHKQFEYTLKDEQGAMGTWLANIDVTSSGQPRRIMYTKHLSVLKMDANSLVNALTFMSIVGLDEEEKFLPSVKFIEQFVDKLLVSQGRYQLLEGQTYYPNRFPIYLFLSRYVAHSPTAKRIFGEKLKGLIRSELLDMDVEWAKAMDIACVILASLYHGLHDKNNEDPDVGLKLQKMYDYLPSLQQEDGSFARHILFKMSHQGHYAGSKQISTALVVSAMGRYRRLVIEGNTTVKDI